MYCIQLGEHAWLDAEGHVTTSHAHAVALAAHETAQQFASSHLPLGRQKAVEHLPPRACAHYRNAPVSIVPLSELQARFAAAPAAPKDKGAQGAEPKAPGVTALVYRWCLDHPEATRADARAAWPNANPSTVNVQFGAARKAAAV